MTGHRAILNMPFPASCINAIRAGRALGEANMTMAFELDQVTTPQEALAFEVTHLVTGLHTAVVCTDDAPRMAAEKTEQFKRLLSEAIAHLQTLEAGLTTETVNSERPDA
ncbi:MAG: hypothetical protein NVV72_01230 [Asticcacaulis sp.]|nr:hypothetical protein [Asticcacaulis sp.]